MPVHLGATIGDKMGGSLMTFHLLKDGSSIVEGRKKDGSPVNGEELIDNRRVDLLHLLIVAVSQVGSWV